MIFDAPQWKLVMDDIERPYAYVQNRVVVSSVRHPPRSVLMKVPTEFFPFVETVFSKHEMQLARKLGVEFVLDEQDDGYWYFGFSVVTKAELYRYLWRYTTDKVPPWMTQ